LDVELLVVALKYFILTAVQYGSGDSGGMDLKQQHLGENSLLARMEQIMCRVRSYAVCLSIYINYLGSLSFSLPSKSLQPALASSISSAISIILEHHSRNTLSNTIHSALLTLYKIHTMHIARIFAVIATTALLPATSAGCFSTGTTWGSSANRAQATSDLDGVCNELQGNYGASVVKSRCRNGQEGIRFNFAVKHISGGTRFLGVRECIDGLNKEITGCDKGGRTGYDNWEYTLV
jgi:hypothetical protein